MLEAFGEKGYYEFTFTLIFHRIHCDNLTGLGEDYTDRLGRGMFSPFYHEAYGLCVAIDNAAENIE